MTKKKKQNGIHEPDRGHGEQPVAHRIAVPGANGSSDAVVEARARMREQVERIQADASLDEGAAIVKEHALLENLVSALRENTDTLRQVHGLSPIVRVQADTDEEPKEEQARD
jgi:hypothetical protein